MGATSNNINDIAIWVEKVIDSCETPMQEVYARKLIRLFEHLMIEKIMNNTMNSDTFKVYTRKLRDKLDYHDSVKK